jgi:TonB family protein
VIKASVLLTVMFCLSGALRRRSASERHLMWVIVLALASALPVFSVLLPSWQPDSARRAAAVFPVLFQSSVPAEGTDADDVVVRAESLDASNPAFARLLTIVWLGGAGLVLIGIVQASRRLARGAAAARPVGDTSWGVLVADVSRSLGSNRSIQLLQHAHDSMPVTWGLLRPRVVLPACATQWSDERKRLVLAHELAHVNRADWFVHLAAKLVCAVYWFNPLFWMAYRRLCVESEQACDDAVLNLGVDRRDYATHLLEIARALSIDRALGPALAMARPSNLERRFRALLDGASSRRPPTRLLACTVAFLVLLAALPLAAIDIPAPHATIHIRTAGLPPLPESAGSSSRAAMLTAIRDVRTDGTPASGDDRVTPPAVLEYSTPALYSDEARNRRIEGVVTLDVQVDARGHAEVLRVLKGLGFGLDENARLAVRTWVFVPARRQGHAIDSTTAIDIPFSLANEAVNELIANDMATRLGPGIVPPRVVRRAAVPRSAPTQTAVRTGAVVLDFVLLEDGTPKIVRITRSIDPALDRAAVHTFEQWRFSPALKDGVPVKVRMNAEVMFHFE